MSASFTRKARYLTFGGLATLTLGVVAQLAVVPGASSVEGTVYSLQQTPPITNTGFEDESGETCPGSPEEFGWHFVAKNQGEFTSLTVTFEDAGTITLGEGDFGPPSDKHAYVYTPTDDTLLSASATIVGGGANTAFVLSHTCAGDDVVPTATPTATPTCVGPMPSGSVSPTGTASPTCGPTESVSPTGTASPTCTGMPSESVSPTSTASPTCGPTESVSPTGTASPTCTGMPSESVSPTSTASPTCGPTESVSPTGTSTPTESVSPTGTGTPTESVSPTGTGTPSESVSPTGTGTPSESVSPTGTGTPTESVSPTGTGSPTESVSPTGTGSPTESVAPTGTGSPSESVAPTGTSTPTDGATVLPTGFTNTPDESNGTNGPNGPNGSISPTVQGVKVVRPGAGPGALPSTGTPFPVALLLLLGVGMIVGGLVVTVTGEPVGGRYRR